MLTQGKREPAACLVGVLPLAEDGAFALPDRVRSDGVLSRGFDGCFGLSEDEVRSVLRQYGEGSADEVRNGSADTASGTRRQSTRSPS